ncbi:MAG: hypothetical protein M0Q91_17130 [Methanoregula sp.]|jgi:hypothetical protein|nr:hypothetical protein [Methanoregula sp.]
MVNAAVENPPDETTKKTREKSVRYPANNLKECVDFLAIVHSIGGRKDAPIESILSKLNLTSPDTKSFKYLVSSAEIFGLIEKTNTGIKPTEAGTLILYPPGGEEQKRKMLIDAFRTPQLYQKVIEQYDNMILPSNVILRSVFLQKGIAPKALDNAVDSFINSAQYADVIDSNNRLILSGTDNAPPIQPPEPENTNLKEKSDFQQKPTEPTELPKKDTDYHRFEFITSTGKKASVLLPSDCTNKDIEKLKGLLDVFISE